MLPRKMGSLLPGVDVSMQHFSPAHAAMVGNRLRE